MTRTNYKEIRTALQRVQDARNELNKRARLNIGVISGGPDMTGVNAEFDTAYRNLSSLVQSAITNGARLSYLLGQIEDEREMAKMVREEIWNRENLREP